MRTTPADVELILPSNETDRLYASDLDAEFDEPFGRQEEEGVDGRHRQNATEVLPLKDRRSDLARARPDALSGAHARAVRLQSRDWHGPHT